MKKIKSIDKIIRVGDEDDKLQWVFRRPYQFMRAEKFFHNRSLWGAINGIVVMVLWVAAAFFPHTVWFLFKCTGHAWTYCKEGESDVMTFHFGMLLPDQRYLLEYEAPQKIGNPVSFTEDSLGKYTFIFIH